MGAVIDGVGFRPFWLRLPGAGPYSLDGLFDSSFLLEARLEAESFEPLIGFLAFLVQKLWSKNNDIIP